MKSPKIKNKSRTTIDFELQDIFVTFHQRLVVSFRKKMEDLNFTLPQMEVLHFVLEKNKPTMKDIATHLSISAPSATSMIEHLSHKKLIRRKMDPKDRRTVHIFLTPKASKLFLSFIEMKSQIFGDMLKNLIDDEKKELATILKKLI